MKKSDRAVGYETDREIIGEKVGYYFGLQRALNKRLMPLALQRELKEEMNRVAHSLPPGTIENWPARPRKMMTNEEISN